MASKPLHEQLGLEPSTRPRVWKDARRIGFMHGFNVSDGGVSSLGPIAEELNLVHGYPAEMIRYGYQSLLTVRYNVQFAMDQLLAARPPVVFAHSNAVPVVYKAMYQTDYRPRAVIAYQPAHNRNRVWPPAPPSVLVLHNPRDIAVRAGRWWRWLNPVSWFVEEHYWGSAGARGYKNPGSAVSQVNTAPYYGHSYLATDSLAVIEVAELVDRFIHQAFARPPPPP